MTDVHDQMVALLPRLRRFCRAIAGSPDAGDDLAQATVERALTRIGQWEPGTRLDSWMYRIARNLNIDAARTRGTRGVSVDAGMLESEMGEDGRSTVEARSDLHRAQQAMASLPEEQRTLLALVAIDGRSYKDAAELLEIPIGTVMSRLARARRAIDLFVNGPAAGPAEG